MEFFIKCMSCKREERITITSFKRFVGEKKSALLKKEMERKDIIGMRLVFHNECPFCKKDGRSVAEVVPIRKE